MKDFSPHAILRDPLTPDSTVEGADPRQLDLFERRGPGHSADRAVLRTPEGSSLIAKAVAGIRGAA